MSSLLSIIIIIGFSALITLVTRRLKIPSVVALIIAGLIIGIDSLEKLVIDGSENLIASLGDAGLLGLMFLAGLESSWKMLYR